jgi:Uma2 family endonuclease
MGVQLARRLFTVDEYDQMAQAGILTEDDRVELLDGEVVQMTPIGSRHADCVNRLTQLVVEQVARRAVVSVQNPVRLGERSEPQPDLALLRLRPSYAAAHPGPEDILLII